MPAVNYDWDEIEDNIDEEYDENGNTIVEYTTEPTLYGSVISQNRGGVTSHYHFDGLGNTTELTNDAGVLTDTRRYSAFGEVTESSGNTAFVLQYGGRFGYVSNAELSVQDVRRRMYSASQCRWLVVDPPDTPASSESYPTAFAYTASRTIAEAECHIGTVPYIYACNAPTRYIDPSGRFPAVSVWTRPCTIAETNAAKIDCGNRYPKGTIGLVAGCLQARITRIETIFPHQVLFECTRTTVCCWGPCQYYERWCIWGAHLPPGDPGKWAWTLTVEQCRQCGDQCVINGGRWGCKIGGGKGFPRWPGVKNPFVPTWPPDGTDLEVLLCLGLATVGAGGAIVPKGTAE